MSRQQHIDLVKQAELELAESSHLFEMFAKDWGSKSNHPLDDVETIKTLQLVLQYRLDTQSALRQLASLHNHLRQVLGIEGLHSSDVNFERMEYALGNEDLHNILTMLNQLVDALLRIIAHSSKQHIMDRKKSLEHSKKQKCVDLMCRVIDKQKSFVKVIQKIALSLEDKGGAPHPGIVHDHIAALEGPISRFYQALQHGLILSDSLYQQKNIKPKLEHQLADTLVKTDQLLRHYNELHEQQSVFKPMLQNTNSLSLEERASAKRLGNFFNH